MACSLAEICDLPNEVLHEIFLKLTPEDVIKYVTRVCNRWNAIVKENKVFWENLQLAVHCDYFLNCSHFNEEFNNNDLSQTIYPNELFIGEKDLELVSSLRYIKFVEGSKAYCSPALLLIRILDFISKTCKNIEKVEFDHCFGGTSKEFIQLLRERYNSITELRFGINVGYRIPYCEISRFTNITTLVSHDYAFKRRDLNLLADSCETLTCLWILLSRSPKVEDMLYFLEKKKHILKELGLGMKLQDCILEKIKECHQLEVFFATDARCISDSCIRSFKNLPSLKYFSLHEAKVELNTLWWMMGRSPGISPHLVILDMTGYKYKLEFFDSLLQKQDCYLMWKNSNFVTFENPIKHAVMSQWFTKSKFHWMYRDKLVWNDYLFWKNERSC